MAITLDVHSAHPHVGGKAQLVHWFGWVAIGTAFTEYFSAIFTGVERMAWKPALKVASKSVVIIAALIVLLRTHDVAATVRIMGVFSILSIAVGALIVRYRLGAFGFHFDAGYIRGLLLQSLPVFGSMAFMILYDSQDILLLNYFKITDHDIGLFAMALKVIDVIKVLPVLLASSFLPSLSRQAHASRPDFFSGLANCCAVPPSASRFGSPDLYFFAPHNPYTVWTRL